MLDNVWRMDCGLDKAQSRETLASSQRITLSFGKMVIYYALFGCNSMDHGHGYHVLCRTYGSHIKIGVPVKWQKQKHTGNHSTNMKCVSLERAR